MATATLIPAVEGVTTTERKFVTNTRSLQPGDVVYAPENDYDYAKVERTTTTGGRDAEVTLTLTEEEAQVVLEIVQRVGGSVTGPRRHADAILRALRETDLEEGEFQVREDIDAIYFK